jgi:hypothetical protein
MTSLTIILLRLYWVQNAMRAYGGSRLFAATVYNQGQGEVNRDSPVAYYYFNFQISLAAWVRSEYDLSRGIFASTVFATEANKMITDSFTYSYVHIC